MKLEYLNSVYELYQIDHSTFTIYEDTEKISDCVGDILPGVIENNNYYPSKKVQSLDDIVAFDRLVFKSLYIDGKFYAYKLIGKINNQLKQV